MTETQFLITLAQTRKAYNWSTEGKTIVGVAKNGKARGKKYAPITAVCRYAGKGTNPSTKRGTTKAGKHRHLPRMSQTQPKQPRTEETLRF